jgi:hypothetical protein
MCQFLSFIWEFEEIVVEIKNFKYSGLVKGIRSKYRSGRLLAAEAMADDCC